jgi:hypothetical protein
MPPEDKNKNNLPPDILKIGLDPVFKDKTNEPTKTTPDIPATAFNILKNQQYVPSQATTPIPPKPVINLNPDKKSLVRTYKGDIESAIQASHLSSINIALAENEKLREKIKNEPATPTTPSNYSTNKIIIFISAILILTGIIGLTTLFLVKKDNSLETIQVQTLPSLITTEFKDELDTSLIPKDRVARTLSSRLNDTQITVNNFYNTYLTVGTGTQKRLASTGEFIALLGLTIPDIIKRTLLPDYMIGMYMFGQNLPFVIFKTTYFENAYAGMFEWEKNLENDFKLLFRLPGYQEEGGILGELTPTTVKKFEDAVVINKDVRLIKDETGRTILLYGIVDKETVVITVNETAFKEIVNRLNKEKGLKR